MKDTVVRQRGGTCPTKEPVELPEILDILIVGGGPAGTAAAFRAKELGLSALVIDLDDIMRRIRDYAKGKPIKPDYGGGDTLRFPQAGELISLLHFPEIDKDEMYKLWKSYYYEYSIPAKIGVEFTGMVRTDDELWQATCWNSYLKQEEQFLARHIIMAIGRGFPRRFDIPGNTLDIAYRLNDAANYVGEPVCIVGGGTSAAEAVIAISDAKAQASDPTAIYWSYRGDKMPKVSRALADEFFNCYVGNGNILYYPRSEPVAVVTPEDNMEYLAIRIDRKCIPGRPSESAQLEFVKQFCIACIGEDIPEAFLNELGLPLVTGGPTNKKRMLVSPLLETVQENVYYAGDILSQAYLSASDFTADAKTFEEIKHRGNIKSALVDGVLIVNVIAQKLAGEEVVERKIEFAEPVGAKEPVGSVTIVEVESDGPPPTAISTQGETENLGRLIRILPGDVEGDEYPVALSGTTTIGRQDCDITFEDDTYLSDKHASISHGPEGYSLRDDGSRNGVFLQAKEGRLVEVGPGDIVRAGKQFLLFAKSEKGFKVRHYDHTGKEIQSVDIAEGTILLGRDAPDVILDANDQTLSRRQLAISLKDGKLGIKDLKSANGTWLKVKNARPLEQGDCFRVGQQTFVFTLKQDAVLDDGVTTKPPTSIITPGPAPEPSPEPGPVPEPGPEPSGPPPPAEGELVVTFKNIGKSFPIKKGQTICELAEACGLAINAECHAGICGSDPLKIISGKEHFNDVTAEESEALEDICGLTPGEYRLACIASPTGGPVEIELLSS